MLDATEEPVPSTRVLNGVAVPGTEFDEEADHYPDHEGTVVRALRRHVRRGDRVVVVGGGWGTTSVVAARMTHFEGAVTTYEPSPRMLAILRRTIDVNRVADVVSVEHAAVGTVSANSERIFGEADGEQVPPDELPDCDVLDLDCEGAELEILRGMPCRPRLLTVEAHPHVGCSQAAVEAELDALGYEVLWKEPIRPGDDIVNYVAMLESA
ncbi:FkbM family methyltransferase [Haloarchaeobius amylolyticus]|uniref:FkbM family methyltransferase n=1 Tax=Haloarchaeobius amylolyticus TaxID=1198296 RepID=UPI00226EB43A|nr:FkbM family methyltransferase [Haloarchaeobius amylolyticus]